MIRNDDNDHLATRGRTSICRSSVLNLGDNPRVKPGKAAGGARRMPRLRGRRNYYPGHPKVLSLLLKCVPLGFRGSVRRGFKAAMDSRPKMPDDLCICGTPLRWIQDSLREKQYHVTQLRSLDENFEVYFLNSQHKMHTATNFGARHRQHNPESGA